ncbi:MAG: exodeoxyribonuclease VII small subunit [Peptoniphilaceae bacterium]|nr:exodeoxyribonuclease VII small subunit [Peptoniphilaceae bacterium]MDY6086020.1 exodeoxyribonuclease VII small subunit [Peptoniphilaceae bacterium]
MEATETFEQGMKRLEEMTQKMQRDDLTLDASVALYREARELADALHDKLDQAALTIETLDGKPVEIVRDQA